MTHKQITDRMIRIGLLLLPFLIFYGYRVVKGFDYPVVDDIMVNQTILSGDNMLLPYIGILLSSALVFLQQLFTIWNIYQGIAYLVSVLVFYLSGNLVHLSSSSSEYDPYRLVLIACLSICILVCLRMLYKRKTGLK